MKAPPTENTYRLSPMQQGMLFHSLQGSRPGVDVEQIFATLHESVDAPALERAWQRVVERHAILRTRFLWEGLPAPQQEVQARVRLHWDRKDWRGLPAAERRQRFEALLEAECTRGFAPSVAPLLRLALIRVAEDEYVLLWTFHHLLLDGRAVVVVLNEVFAQYDAIRAGRELVLEPPPPLERYIDWLDGQDWSSAEAFWRENLRGFRAPTPLPNLAPRRTGVSSLTGLAAFYQEQALRLPESLTSALQLLCQQHDLTLNTVLQGAWALILSVYSGEPEVVFGAVRACRHAAVPGVESMVGMLINTLPVRVSVPVEMRVLPWLNDLRRRWRALREYEDTPLIRVQGWSDVPPGRPLFETIFNYQDPSWDTALRAQGGPWAQREWGIRSHASFPLVIDAYGGSSLLIKVLYHPDRFEASAMTRLLGHWQTVLESIAGQPEQSLATVPLLTPAERQQIVVEWNQTHAQSPLEQTVPALVAEQVRRQPEALAVADAKGQLTYAQLDEQAERLARELRGYGMGPNRVAAVGLERSIGMVAACLAVWKTGGAYLPLDPSYPAARLAAILAEAQVSCLVTRTGLLKLFPSAGDGLPTLCVDDLAELTRGHEPAPAPALTPARPEDLAYVIYTSGSTGTPKGVEIEHRSLANLVAWHQAAYQVSEADRATQLASPAFDASIWEIWPYLASGASVRIPEADTVLAPPALLGWLAAERITLTFLPTPLLEALFDQTWPGKMVLRAILTGGDKLHQSPPSGLPCPVINHYGPTENTVVSTCTRVQAQGDDPTVPPIGRPIAHTQAYVLEHRRQPAPIGIAGELWLGGMGLARGYHGRPDLTAEKFVSNPFLPNTRLYRTGDRVRYLPNGELEFLGRFDQQVKIRGHRIELGEIEAALLEHPSVREAMVVARADAGKTEHLVGYLAPSAGASVTVEVLLEFLRGKLPDYMVPSALVVLEAFPLSPNGKIDREALPAPDWGKGTGRPFVAPRNPTESKLAQIWSEVLGVQPVGVHDRFFELGGHSLLATQVISRVREVWQREVPLGWLFDAPTVAGLAERLLAFSEPQPAPVAPDLAARPAPAEIPLSFAQERLWFLEQLEPGQAFNNIPLALELEGPLQAPALEEALREILRRHQSLRTSLRKANGRPVGSLGITESFRLARVDLSDYPAEEQMPAAKSLARAEAQRPFDLTRGPLLRATLLRFSDAKYQLLLTMHHICSDGWSLGILYRELAALYVAFAKGHPSPLPELPLQYADYAQWQKEWLQSYRLESQLAYWREQLKGPLPVLELATDRPRPAVQTYHGTTHHFALPPRLAQALKALGQAEEATLFMVLLAAFQTLLGRQTNQEEVLVGSPIAGRTRLETEHLIGCFLNTLVFRGDLGGNPTFRELLCRVRQTALAAYAHQEAPFEKVVETLQPERDLARPPLFQAMFILQNEPLPALELAELKATPIPVDSGTAKFDLTLSLEEQGGGLAGFVEYNSDLFLPETMGRLLAHFENLLEHIVAQPDRRLSELELLSQAERRQLLEEWNETRLNYPAETGIHQLIEAQARRAPAAVAVQYLEEQLTYAELEEQANRWAAILRAHGVGPDERVGLCVDRSLEMLVGLLGILKAGGAYLPLDPDSPPDRLAGLLSDAQPRLVLTEEALRLKLDALAVGVPLLCLDRPGSADPAANLIPGPVSASDLPRPETDPAPGVAPDQLAYVLYTSGSTGRPKGVMVTHRNVVNFFAGMDQLLGTEPGVWLAVTNITFDISVLELLWPLTHGFKVIIHPGDHRTRPIRRSTRKPPRELDFSLFYFADDREGDARHKYRLLLEGAKFADQHGFAAVWTPERHFHSFGGLYPNPALTSCALAMTTQRLQLRAGSVVLPLHHPLRVAEEWAVVDNLSHGRVGVSFASGWHDQDFALAPENYAQRRQILFENIQLVRRLWRGETARVRSGSGELVEVKIYPRPIQPELPVWVTAAGTPETFRKAGEIGANLLTHLLGQTLGELAERIRLYREARAKQGWEGPGSVALMLHTFVAEELEEARAKTRQPLIDYLKSSVDLIRNLAHNLCDGVDFKHLTEEDLEALASHAFDRYFELSGLLGTPESCLPLLDHIRAIGVDEVACLLDFGIEEEAVLAGLSHLDHLKELSRRRAASAPAVPSIPETIIRQGVTHLQCTPSLAEMLIAHRDWRSTTQHLQNLLVGGEALPAALAERLGTVGRVYNMYGPTETTIWSSAYLVQLGDNPVPIGRPLANTRMYVLDRAGQPAPVGVAGELYIGGAGVALGYLNRPDLTRERFIVDPFNAEPGARLYRTGDRARYRSDGHLEFLGRVDHQIKLRGYRIELEEIEACLAEHPAVGRAIAALRKLGAQDERLVAYVLPTNGHRPAVRELREFLRQRLPEPMVPATFVFLEHLPLTPSGKVDRQALPAPAESAAERAGVYAEPRTSLERKIAAIWQELLGVERVGLEDNFFDLGGHSLLLVRLQSRLREVLNQDVSIVQLFERPNVRALSQALSQATAPTGLDAVRDRGKRRRSVLVPHLPPEVAA